MRNNIVEDIKARVFKLIKEAKDVKSLEEARVKFLGRKEGELTKLLRSLKDLPLAEKRKIGPAANALRKELEALLVQKLESFKALPAGRQSKIGIDVTMPGKKVFRGGVHPITLVEKEIREIFKAMNFSVMEGPEVESEYYNFDALNIPQDHPARDMWDTFWLRQNEVKSQKLKVKSEKLLLRTHTSPVQIRYMEIHKPPFQIIVPGRVFRYEATDASHEINFYQVEGLMVGKDISLANFKFVIEEFFKRLFKKNLKIRLRPSYFPFVEPGLEVDVQCVRCGGRARLPDGQGCNICKESGWLEVMGAGMVHPRVFEAAHYNPREWQGFAFGLGLERIAMIQYNIPDIRLFYSGDLRFVKQF